ncbi:MAG: DNA adenine methylase [Pirellulaceae bacterium]
MQGILFEECERRDIVPVKGQLLKWIGNKQRFAVEISSYFPWKFGRYFEPFLGSGAVLAAVSPKAACASDVFAPLIEIWQTLQSNPEMVKEWYAERWRAMRNGDKIAEYEKVKAAFNNHPNGPDLLFLSRTCYGGVVRFRRFDGAMSTPCGPHSPVSPSAFARRVDEWHRRTTGAEFAILDFADAMERATSGDLVYCDPPYIDTQKILYGAQSFTLSRLFESIRRCKDRGVLVALSIDGTKQSGKKVCNVSIPDDLFARDVSITCGRSMLRRFQMEGQTLEEEIVADRLLLTY